MNDQEDFDLKKRLIDKSIEAYVLALETINRLTIQYRLETFCFLFCNSWELLLKAKILAHEDNPDSIYKKRTGRNKRSLSLRDCLRRVIPNDKDPTRRNIERIEELRDKSVHLVIDHIPSDVMCLFQAGVINYHHRLSRWFEESLTSRYPLGMMSIIYDRDPEQKEVTYQHLSRQLGPASAGFLSRYCAELKQEFDDLQQSAEFSISINHHLVLTKRRDDADIVLSSGPTGDEPARIIEIAKDPSLTHPYRQKELIEELKEAIPEAQMNSYDIQCVNKVYRTKNKSEHFYQGKVKNSPGQYSRAFVDWLVEQYRRDEQFFRKTRARVKKSTT